MKKFLGDFFLGWWKDRDADIGIRLGSGLLIIGAAESLAMGCLGLLFHYLYVPVLSPLNEPTLSAAVWWVLAGLGVAMVFPASYMLVKKQREVKPCWREVCLHRFRDDLLRLRSDYFAHGWSDAAWNALCDMWANELHPALRREADIIRGLKIRRGNIVMARIADILLFIPAELAGAWVMHDLRRWAREYRREAL